MVLVEICLALDCRVQHKLPLLNLQLKLTMDSVEMILWDSASLQDLRIQTQFNLPLKQASTSASDLSNPNQSNQSKRPNPRTTTSASTFSDPSLLQCNLQPKPLKLPLSSQ
jgi:hypothetical protein